MVMIILGILGIIVVIGISSFIYYLQKLDEETQELKNIIKNVHDKVLMLKSSPAYENASDEIRNILDFVTVNTASTTVFKPSSGFLKKLRKE
ncbi:MAG: hypothetical protein V1830_05220 [Candidatus Omnitrophota bacterium]